MAERRSSRGCRGDADPSRRRAGLRLADRRGGPAARAVPRRGRAALLRGPEHRGHRAAAGLRPRHGAVAAVAGAGAAAEPARAARGVARGRLAGRRGGGSAGLERRRSRRRWSRTRSAPPPRWPWAARRSRASSRPPSPPWRAGWPGRWSFSRVRTAACLFILAAAGVSIGLAASHGPADEPARPAAARPRRPRRGGRPRPREKPARIRSSSAGRSLDPDGKPVAGAAIVVSRPDGLRSSGSPRDQRGGRPLRGRGPVLGDRRARPGRPRSRSSPPWPPGSGPAWVKIDRQAAAKPVAIRLVRDDVPIEGRIIGLEGRGVPDARVSVFAIADLPGRVPRDVAIRRGPGRRQ